MKLGEIVKRTEVDYEYINNKRNKLFAIALTALGFTIYAMYLALIFIILIIDESGNFLDLSIDYSSLSFSIFFVQLIVFFTLMAGFWMLYSTEKKEYQRFRLTYDYCLMQIDDDEEILEDSDEIDLEKTVPTEVIKNKGDDSENCKTCGNPYRYVSEKEDYYCDTCQKYYQEK